MSAPIPIIGTLTAGGQPFIVGLALSPPPSPAADHGQSPPALEDGHAVEVVSVEVHETVPLVTLAEEEVDDEEEDIDLRVEEMDDPSSRLDTIEEQQEETAAAEEEEEKPAETAEENIETKEGNIETEENINETVETRTQRVEVVEVKEQPKASEVGEEKPVEEEEVQMAEEEKKPEEAAETITTTVTRKMTVEEDQAMQELLRELDEQSRLPPAAEEPASYPPATTCSTTVVEVHEVGVPPASQEEVPNTITTTTTTTTTTILGESSVSKTVDFCNQQSPVSTSVQVEATILEDNNTVAEPFATGTTKAAAGQQSAPAKEEEIEQQVEGKLELPVQKESSPPVVVRMRQKAIERQQPIVIDEQDQQQEKQMPELERTLSPIREPSSVWTRQIAKVEVVSEPEKTQKQRWLANGEAQRAEEVELRRAMEELQAVQPKTPPMPKRQEPAAEMAQNGGAGFLVERKTVVQRQVEIQRTEPAPPPQQQPPPVSNGHGPGESNGFGPGGARAVMVEHQTTATSVPGKENARPIQIQLQPHQQYHHLLPAAEKQLQPMASPASNASSSTTPQQQQQYNGTWSRGPGTRSPFGHLSEMTEEDWRLSPKTLSRIKRLKVVMEPTTAAAAATAITGMAPERIGEAKDAEVIHHHPIFVKDTSRFWYKPTISREEAISMLKTKPPGTFVVRDSNSFPGAFGLALKVAQPPAGVTANDGSELVRHFLIEPSAKGVRLKGCSNEPVFGTLAALVYQHSITPLALPCRLILPEYDPASSPEHLNSNQALLERGAACNVSFLCSVDTESLTGPEAVRRSAAFAFELLQRRELRAVPVHFKVSSQGVTLTDNTRSLFFRRHYPVNSVTFAGIDPESRVFDNNNVSQLPPTYVRQAPVFGFVARKNPANGYNGTVENACHIFAELDPDQPASAVVRFITNVMMPAGRAQLQQIHQNANQNTH